MQRPKPPTGIREGEDIFLHRSHQRHQAQRIVSSRHPASHPFDVQGKTDRIDLQGVLPLQYNNRRSGKQHEKPRHDRYRLPIITILFDLGVVEFLQKPAAAVRSIQREVRVQVPQRTQVSFLHQILVDDTIVEQGYFAGLSGPAS